VDFLTGTWFEDRVFHRLKACFEGQPGTEVIAGLKLTLADDQSRRQEVLDIDAAVFRDNQLQVVECRTCVCGRDKEDGRSLSHRDMSRVADTAHDLVGPYGIAALASLSPPPASKDGRRHVRSLTEAGRAKGVRFTTVGRAPPS